MKFLESALRIVVAGVLISHTTITSLPAQLQSFDPDEYTLIGFRSPDGTIQRFDGCGQVLRDGASGLIASSGSANCFGASPLHLAAMGAPQAIPTLIEAGADIEAEMSGRLTPLHSAVSMGNLPAAKLLLMAGANAQTRNNNGATLLHTLYGGRCHSCTSQDRLTLARELIRRGVSTNDGDNGDATALHYAVMSEDALVALDELLGLGADSTVRDSNGAPVWFYASLAGNDKAANRARLAAGHKIGLTDDNGNTKEEWVREQEESIDRVSSDFRMSPVVTRNSTDPSALYEYTVGNLPSLSGYYQPKHDDDTTLAEKVICNTAATTTCAAVCAPLASIHWLLAVSCGGICYPIAYAICTKLMHHDPADCPHTIYIYEGGVVVEVEVPCVYG